MSVQKKDMKDTKDIKEPKDNKEFFEDFDDEYNEFDNDDENLDDLIDDDKISDVFELNATQLCKVMLAGRFKKEDAAVQSIEQKIVDKEWLKSRVCLWKTPVSVQQYLNEQKTIRDLLLNLNANSPFDQSATYELRITDRKGHSFESVVAQTGRCELCHYAFEQKRTAELYMSYTYVKRLLHRVCETLIGLVLLAGVWHSDVKNANLVIEITEEERKNKKISTSLPYVIDFDVAQVSDSTTIQPKLMKVIMRSIHYWIFSCLHSIVPPSVKQQSWLIWACDVESDATQVKVLLSKIKKCKTVQEIMALVQ
jgi:hypothetical protein